MFLSKEDVHRFKRHILSDENNDLSQQQLSNKNNDDVESELLMEDKEAIGHGHIVDIFHDVDENIEQRHHRGKQPNKYRDILHNYKLHKRANNHQSDKITIENDEENNVNGNDRQNEINTETQYRFFNEHLATKKQARKFANKNEILNHFSLILHSEEYTSTRTARTTVGTLPFYHDTQHVSPEQPEAPLTTRGIQCLPYVSDEDLFEYYLRNISQGVTTEFILTRKRIRFKRTTTTERGPGVYDSVTSVPGYFDDSLGKLVDEYVDSGPRVNTSEVMRIRERDAKLLKEGEEREARGESARSEDFDESIWRKCPIVTIMSPRRPTTANTPTTEPEDEMYDYVIKNKKRRRVGPAETILRTLITKEPYEMFERLYGKVTKVLPITFS